MSEHHLPGLSLSTKSPSFGSFTALYELGHDEFVFLYLVMIESSNRVFQSHPREEADAGDVVVVVAAAVEEQMTVYWRRSNASNGKDGYHNNPRRTNKRG